MLLALALATDLWLRGFSVIPTPRTVRLGEGEIAVDGSWSVDSGAVGEKHIAARALRRDALEFHALELSGGGRRIRLAIRPGAVATKAEPDIDAQAYRLAIGDGGIEITGNGEAGLFYGVQTLLQLLKRAPDGRLVVPKGEIEDWPRLALRFLHWDTKHHQDRKETLKRYLDWAARFKVNMIGFELEDKFEYPSHPEIGAPGAFTTAELQEIVDYGLERYIQVVPEIQAPAHMAYVLKHPAFAALRADGNNYQSALCDPRTYDLVFSMYDDVIRATRGVKYLFASTDEVYYAGIDCARPYNPVNRSLAWVEFVRRARDHVARQGRRMLVWAEYPLLAEHVGQIPADVIDGVIGEPEYLEAENKLGIRQLAYVSMQGGEFLFPNHLALEGAPGRLADAYESLLNGRHWKGNPIGAFAAAWDDAGLHNETFWLGWSAVAQWAWNPGGAPVEQHAAEFMRFYYGPEAAGMAEVYRAMQRQAAAWERSWDRVVSRVRGPGYGNSYGKGIGVERRDLALSPPSLPAEDLAFEPSFSRKYVGWIAEARALQAENDRLAAAIEENLARASRNRYNLEVLLSLAVFVRHHWRLFAGLNEAEKSLEAARDAHGRKNATQAVGRMVSVFNSVERLRAEGERTFSELTAVYEKSRYPKGRSVGGRAFVHVLDDTKDHWADRTADLSFMMAAERSMGLDKWLASLRRIIEAYAKAQGVEVKGLGAARLEE